MLEQSILNNDLNGQVSYYDFFHALGYADSEKYFFRIFRDKGTAEEKKNSAQNRETLPRNLDYELRSLHALNEKDCGIFYVVNGGGQTDAASKKNGKPRAQFIDFDDFPFEEQIEKLNGFPLEPSIIIKTRKSLHCYWLLDDGAQFDYWEEVQKRLIQYFGSDPVIKNPSRVMRLYGFEHRKSDPVMVTLIKYDPALRYNQRQFHEALPRLEKKTKHQANAIPEIMSSSMSSVPAANRDHDEQVAWFLSWSQRNNVEIMKQKEKGNGTTVFYVECPWSLNHTEDTGAGQSAVLIDEKGQIAYVCQHSHCSDRTWADFRKCAEESAKTVISERQIDQEVRESIVSKTENVSQGIVDTPETDKTPKDSFRMINVGDFIEENGYDDSIQYFQRYHDRKIGFENLDKYLTLYPGVACLGGASSLGKTTFAVNVVDNLLANGETVIYFALEQLPIELVTKSLARRVYELDPFSRINNIDIKNGATSEALVRAKSEYKQTAQHYYIVEGDFTFTAQKIIKYVESFISATGIRPIVVIDYLQLIAPPEGFRGTLREIVDENLKAIKDLSKRNELFILLISSFNRSSYKEPVSMESFKESSMIEYTCDYILGLQLSILEDSSFYTTAGSRGGERDNNNDKKEKMLYEAINRSPKEVELVGLKNRNGKQRFKCFFKYYMQYDVFVPDLKSRYDPDLLMGETERTLSERLFKTV